MIRFAFYGRVSTDDQQDPEASRAWQRHVATQLIASHGEIVEEYFDISVSRSIPWSRRDEAKRLLTAMRSGKAGFDAVVIGEPQRAFYGNQFGNTWPLLVEFGFPLWVPEKGGPLDPRSDADEFIMTLFGGLSKSERQRIKQRVRMAMSAMASAGGRFLGGRPPYGYLLVDAGPHPNPAKAADGKRLHRLELDPSAAPVVESIFQMRLEGKGVHAIAHALNKAGTPCPSAHDPGRNRHRRGDRWQASTVLAILRNPRYTGFETWGRMPRHERLISVDDVAAGHRTVQTRAPSDAWITSGTQSHPAIVSTVTFKAVQTLSGEGTAPRKPRESHFAFPLSGLMFCGDCGARLEADRARWGVRYRCRSHRRGVMSHGARVDVPEASLLTDLDAWLSEVLSPDRLEAAVDEVMAALSGTDPHRQAEIQNLRSELSRATQALENLANAVTKGVNAEALAEPLNQAHAEKLAAQARLEHMERELPTLSREEVAEALGTTWGLPGFLQDATEGDRADLYRELGIRITINHATREAEVALDLGNQAVGQSCVGGGT